MRLFKRLLCVATSLLVVTGSMAGCNQSGSSSGSSSNVKAINGGKPVTIVVNLGEYNPSVNEKATAANTNVFNSTRKIAKQFMTMYPNVTVKFDTSTATTGGDYVESLNQWMLPRLAAGNAMDIATNLGGAAIFGDDGWFMDMSKYLNTPNEFIKGNTKWKDEYPSYELSDTSIVNTAGNTVGVPFMLSPGTSTAYYYNKSIFSQLKLAIPKTWQQFIDECAVIKKAGYIPFAPYSVNVTADLQCWDMQFSIGPVYAQYLMNQLDYNKDGRQDATERLRAIKQGLYNPLSTPYGMDIYKQIKLKWTNVLTKGFEVTDYSPLWQDGKVAILEDGLWRLPAELSDTKRKFDFGMFPPPVISSDTYSYLPTAKFTTSGPSKPKVKSQFVLLKSSMKAHGAGVEEASVAFVKYMSTAENLSAVALEMKGAVLGPTKDCKVPPELKDWLKQSFPVLPDSTGWLPVSTADGRKAGNKTLEQWLYGQIDDKTFAAQLDSESQQDADKLIKQLNVNTSGWAINEK